MRKNVKKIIIALAVIGLFAALRIFGVDDYITFENLQLYRDQLLAFVNRNYIVSVFIFIIIYIVYTAFALPAAAVITMAGGFVFGFISVIYVNIGATVGATLAFLASRYLLGSWVQNKYGDALEKFNREVEENGKNYFLTLRLIPVFPFFLINVFGGLTRVPLFTYVWTTALGIIPGSFVFVYGGTQLVTVNTVADIISLRILLALVFLGILAVVPVAVKKIKGNKSVAIEN